LGVADIIHKCLAPLPGDRYSNAAGLAEDLRRHLASLPLKQVANRSLAERWRKWRRRQPQTIGMAAMLLVILAVAALMLRSHHVQRLGEADAALARGQQEIAKGDFEAAEQSLRRGLASIGRWPLSGSRGEHLQNQLRRARRMQAAGHLGRLVEQLRFLDMHE